jgi:hypothetical protein
LIGSTGPDPALALIGPAAPRTAARAAAALAEHA